MTARGFTVVELLVVTAIVVTVSGAVFSVVAPVRAIADLTPVSAELTQRGRVGLEMLARDLRSAGVGVPLSGAGLGADTLPALRPIVGGSGFAGVVLTRVAWGSPAARLAATSTQAGPLVLAPAPSCPETNAVCGFAPGDRVLVFDGSGHFDVRDVRAVLPGPPRLMTAAPLTSGFDAGSLVTAIDEVSYALAPDGDAFRLVRAIGGGPAQPVIDHVVSFEIELFGDGEPPQPGMGDEGPAPSYGPRPPPIGIDDLRDGWGAGENCVVTITDGTPGPRLLALAGRGALVPLTAVMLADGPWCPDAGHPDAFDADLLRLRRVDVRVRIRPADPGMRAPGATVLETPGAIGPIRRWVPDLDLRVSIAPRNRRW